MRRVLGKTVAGLRTRTTLFVLPLLFVHYISLLSCWPKLAKMAVAKIELNISIWPKQDWPNLELAKRNRAQLETPTPEPSTLNPETETPKPET